MPRRQYTAKDFDSDDEQFLSKPDTKGKRKKRKIANNKDVSVQQPKSRALLQSMVDMPVDVLLEIFKHLGLIDVMHLSRTSKSLRSILMSRTSISVWQQAVANDGLPKCTKDLNEPRLAELIFGRSCDWCGRNVSGQEIIWSARVRACKRCIDLAYRQAGRYSDRNYPDVLAKLIPSVDIKQKRYIDADLDRAWGEEYLKRSEDEALKWLEERVIERRIISEHAEACREWFELRLEHQVTLRKAIINERLKERGWGGELDKLSTVIGPTDLKEVVKACQSELTEPILAGLDGLLDRYMQQAKKTRLDREKKEFFRHMLQRLRKISREYSHTLPPDHVFPNTADIYFHSTVKETLSAVKTHEELEEALTGIRPSLPEIFDDLLKLSKQRLTGLVIEEYSRNNKSFNLSVLTLASTLFHCKRCWSDLTLDQTVFHTCRDNYYCYYSRAPEDSEMDAVRSAIDETTTANKIQSTISFSLARLEPFVSVLRSCGINPNTTTAADMNETNLVMECLDCSNVNRGRVTMKWSTVPKHLGSNTHSTHNMAILEEPEAEIVRGRILEQYQKDVASKKEHICTHCRDSGGPMALMQHVKRNHHIDSPVYGQDVIVSPIAICTLPEFNLWPPRL